MQEFLPNGFPQDFARAPQKRTENKDSSHEQQGSFHLQPGMKFIDHRGDMYSVEKLLGEGGMGSVYHVALEREIGGEVVKIDHALKTMRPEWLKQLSPERRQVAMKRFVRECETLAKLHNPFILPIHDVIEIPMGEETMLGLVTEFVEGSTLETECEEHKNGLPSAEVIEYTGEILSALNALQKAHIVHRDLKLANIFLAHTADGKKFVRVGDFGLVAEADSKANSALIEDDRSTTSSLKESRLTDPGTIMGSPSFMSPEQVLGDTMTHQSDLYALGVIMYTLLTGQSVFNDAYPSSVMRSHAFEIPRTLFQRGKEDVPEWLNDVVMKLLEKSPKNRFANAQEVFGALKEGIKKDFPEMLNKEPFMWSFEKEEAV